MGSMPLPILILATLLAAVTSAAAEPSFPIPEGKTITARCVGVYDGDTITLLVKTAEGKRQAKIRLDAIDAPEIGQPFGNRSKQTLSGIVFGKDCQVESMGQDRYGRTIGKINVDSKSVNLAMLEAGMARHFTKYDQTPQFAAAEKAAREAGAGLWADKHAIPPWEWRKMPKAERDTVRKAVTIGVE